MKISRTYRRLDHDLWLQLLSLHTKIVDLRSELSSLVALDWDRCACSRVQVRIPFHCWALDPRMAAPSPEGRTTAVDGACPAWKRDLEVQILNGLEVQEPQSDISTGRGSEHTLGLARIGGIDGAYRPFD